MKYKRKGMLELMLENMGKDAIKKGLIIASPAIGNLSTKLRERIEEKLGEDCYNPVVSGKISAVSNILVYPLLTHKLTHNGWLTAGSLLYAAIERGFRDGISNDDPFEKVYISSLLGKLLSKPVEYIVNLYDRAKKQAEKNGK